MLFDVRCVLFVFVYLLSVGLYDVFGLTYVFDERCLLFVVCCVLSIVCVF